MSNKLKVGTTGYATAVIKHGTVYLTIGGKK